MTTTGRLLVLTTAFAGWLCAGTHLAITSLAMQPAALDLLGRSGALDLARHRAALRGGEKYEGFEADRALVARWFAWYQCSFLFGAATGGLVFGRVGDRLGRVTGMGLSILTYAGLPAVAAFAQAPWQLLVLWYLASTGVGGMWPNGVALVSEAWSELSRPLAAGVIGTSANIGILAMASLASYVPITPEWWQWVMIPASVPIGLGLFVLLVVPESPMWLATRNTGPVVLEKPHVFRPPLLPLTLLGIALASVPMIGAWGSANWMVPWAAEAGEAATPPNPYLKANLQQTRAFTGIISSALGGWIGALVGRRLTYSLTSLAALGCAQYAFWFLTPTDATFLYWVGALGFFSGIYFGWLPLFLPELFPTAARSTGTGVGFNFGRILTAGTIALTGVMMVLFEGDYARIGRVTSLVFIIGVVLVWAAPDTSRHGLGGQPASGGVDNSQGIIRGGER
jgi:SHS family sialic acid transporter-like MFS transporter